MNFTIFFTWPNKKFTFFSQLINKMNDSSTYNHLMNFMIFSFYRLAKFVVFRYYWLVNFVFFSRLTEEFCDISCWSVGESTNFSLRLISETCRMFFLITNRLISQFILEKKNYKMYDLFPANARCSSWFPLPPRS